MMSVSKIDRETSLPVLNPSGLLNCEATVRFSTYKLDIAEHIYN